MHTMTENTTTPAKIAKTDAVIPADVLAIITGPINTLASETNAFMRRSLLTAVKATGDFLTATEPLKLSREKLFTRVVAETNSVSLATLRRWAVVVDVHAKHGVTASEGSASAVYALTEGGMTAAKKAVESAEGITDADSLTEAVAGAMNEHPKVKAITSAEAEDSGASPGDVADAPFTLAALTESVSALLAKQVTDADAKQVVKSLRALVNDYAKQALQDA